MPGELVLDPTPLARFAGRVGGDTNPVAITRVGAPAPLLTLAAMRLDRRLDPLVKKSDGTAFIAETTPDSDLWPHPDDSLLKRLARAVQGELEGPAGWLGRTVGLTTWRLDMPRFGDLELPFPPVRDVTAVRWRDGAGAMQTVVGGTWRLDKGGTFPRLRLAPDAAWPTLPGRFAPDTVQVEYTAGFTDEDPEADTVRTYALQRIGALYENREAFITGTIATESPGVRDMLDNLRLGLPRGWAR